MMVAAGMIPSDVSRYHFGEPIGQVWKYKKIEIFLVGPLCMNLHFLPRISLFILLLSDRCYLTYCFKSINT